MARGAGKNNWALFLLLLAGIVLTFAFSIKITIGSIIGVVLGIIIYHFI